MTTRTISTTETAKLIRKTLKDAFPGVKFSVRSSSYAGGSSIRVSYTDGPCQEAVDAAVKPFAGGSFDGMTDSMSYHTSELNGEKVRFGADFVFTNRDMSDKVWGEVAADLRAFANEARYVEDGTVDAYGPDLGLSADTRLKIACVRPCDSDDNAPHWANHYDVNYATSLVRQFFSQTSYAV